VLDDARRPLIQAQAEGEVVIDALVGECAQQDEEGSSETSRPAPNSMA
jgi:hypothetical protein